MQWLSGPLFLLSLSISPACTRDARRAQDKAAAEGTGASSESSLTEPENSNGPTTADSPSPETKSGEKSPEQDESPTAESKDPETEKSSDKEKEKEDSKDPGSESPEEGPGPEDEPDCVDGDQSNCSESPDGSEIEFPTGAPLGSCSYGKKTCRNGTWGACKGAIAPKSKDTCQAGNDDSCNGVPNEGCECSAKETRPCGTDVGACKKGTQTCGNDGTWGSECKGEVGKQKEICDGRADEDCDGLSDRDDVLDCECLNNDPKQGCQLTGSGDCTLGVKSCKNGAWTRCAPRFSRTRESCGKRTDFLGPATGDEDCDGSIDEYLGGAPLGCKNYIVDEDNDGYGAIGYSANSSSQSPITYGCFCNAPTIGHSWKPSYAQDKINVDCGDCDSNVVPDLGGFSAIESICLKSLNWRGGSFDFDCSESEQKRHPSMMVCKNTGSGCVQQGNGYWSDSEGVPACGESGVPGNQCVDIGDGDCVANSKLVNETQECK